MTSRITLALFALLLVVFVSSNVLAQTDSQKTKNGIFTSSARGGNGGGKPTPTPTPTPTPPPGCATVVANTNSWIGSGGLDTTFGSNGIATSKVSPAGSTAEIAFKVLVQTDGKIVVSGEARNPATLDMDAFVARFHTDGTKDLSFGTPDPMSPGQRLGYVFVDFEGGSDFAYSAALDSAGRILIAAGPYVFKVARLDSNGDLDNSFGTGGKVILSSTAGSVNAIAVQSNGQIVVAGGEPEFVAARLNEDGSLDTSFGNSGTASFSVSSKKGRSSSFANSMAIQIVGGEERFVLGGRNRDGAGPAMFATARLRNDGSLDTSFGNGGVVLTSIYGNWDQIFGVGIDSANRIVAVGSAGEGPCGGDGAIVRYLQNGSLDSSFSGDGKLTLDIYGGDNGFDDIAFQPDGKLIVLGDAQDVAGTVWDASITRLNPDGSLDTGFGPTTLGGGIVATDTGDQDITFGGLQIQQDGKIVAIWTQGVAGESTIARYLQ